MASPAVGSDHPIDGFSIFTLILFFVINILVIFPVYIPIPRHITRPLRQLARRLRILNREDNSVPPSQHSKQVTNGQPIDSRPASPASPPGTTPNASNSDVPSAAASAYSEERVRFPLGLSTAPVIGVLLLLATTSIPGSVVRDGIVGSQGVRPYDIMTLFLSLAYISLSLDCTGLLRFLAFWVAAKGGTSGRKLYVYFFLFFFGSGVLVGNDPIILSGTSFLAYFSRIAGISPPRAWLFSQFAACNVASAVLVSSNPTNLVLTGAYEISFLVYSAWLVLPVLATAVVLVPWLLWWFNDEELIPRTLEPPGVEPKTALIDRRGAVFGSALLGVTLVLLVALSAVGLLEGVQGVWTVTAPAAVVMLLRDLWYDRQMGRWGGKSVEADEKEVVEGDGDGRPEVDAQGMEDLDGQLGRAEGGEAVEMRALKHSQRPKVKEQTAESTGGPPDIRRRTTSGGETAPPSMSTKRPAAITATTPPSIKSPTRNLSPSSTDSKAFQRPTPPQPATMESFFLSLSRRIPTFTHVFVRLPLPLLPFAFSMFILVEALSSTGWMRVWAEWWAAWIDVAGLAGAIWLMGCLSVIGCNIFGTNIGATILLSRVLQQWHATHPDVSRRILYGSIYTLALGSNYGAFSYTFSASLAGLLWKEILRQKGIQVGRWEFLKNNAGPVMICMVVGGLVVAAEVCVMLKD